MPVSCWIKLLISSAISLPNRPMVCCWTCLSLKYSSGSIGPFELKILKVIFGKFSGFRPIIEFWLQITTIIRKISTFRKLSIYWKVPISWNLSIYRKVFISQNLTIYRKKLKVDLTPVVMISIDWAPRAILWARRHKFEFDFVHFDRLKGRMCPSLAPVLDMIFGVKVSHDFSVKSVAAHHRQHRPYLID